MMAARAGARAVHSLEMVPALATVARHIVDVNGFASVVTIHELMSTDLEPSSVGGTFDILVCEIVDDQLLGEGVLTTIDDARRRLLSEQAQIIPSSATVHAQAVELRVGAIAGFRCDDFNLFATDATLAPRATAGCKFQAVPEHRRRTLAPPLTLFDFDFAHDDLAALAVGRRRDDLSLDIERDGVLSGLLVYFTLRCDQSGNNDFDSGPANEKLVAWNQSLRTTPIELRVQQGDRLPLSAEHNHEAVRVGLPQIRPEMVRDERGAPMVGHLEILNATS